MEMRGVLYRMLNHEELTRTEAHDILVGITRSEFPAEQITALLTALQMRGVTVDELLGLRDGILETGVKAVLDCDRCTDIVGTGGDGKNTFNISTCACFVMAGAGYRVAKHGNHAATSASGASDVMQAHGVEFTADTDRLNRSMDGCGVVYLHAPLFARAMKFVAPVRRALCFPTCFNLLGPLVNPSRPHCQLLGVANLAQMRLYRSVYERLGIDYGIVNSTDGYDEISLTGSFKVASNSGECIYSPSDIGMPAASPESLEGGKTVEEAKEIFDSVLENRALPAQRNVVVANAAFAMYVAERGGKGIEECLDMARESLDSGRALATLRKFVEIHDEKELDYLDHGPDICGVNNRNLGTFVTDVRHSFALSGKLPRGMCRVSESGISSAATVCELREAGFDGFLIGENFMKEQSPGLSLGKFIECMEECGRNRPGSKAADIRAERRVRI